MSNKEYSDEYRKLENAIAQLEEQRAIIGDTVVDASIAALRDKLTTLSSPTTTEQRKLITILFADVSGFTAMSETLDAEVVSDIMNSLWQRIDTAIIQHGGRIDKHIGDAVMALWGVQEAREDDPEQAIRAALAMQNILSEFSINRAIGMRIGLSTGQVLLGTVNTTGELSVLGYAVQLSQQLEEAAPTGGVLIAQNTYHHVRGIFDVSEQGSIQAGDEARLIPTYLVQRARPHAFQVTTRGLEGIQTRMVGRDAELLALQNIFYDVVEDNEIRIVTIIGEAGVGKSRLLYEFETWLKSLPDQVIQFKGRTTPEMQNIPYGIFRDLFANRFNIRESDNATIALEKFREGLAITHQPEKADLIGHLVGFDFSASNVVSNLLGSPSFAQLAIADLINYLRTITTEPTVIFLEDIHWADDSSLDLVDRVVTAISMAPLLIICVTRPRFFERRFWGEGRTMHSQLNLKPLSRRTSRALVDEILQKVSRPPTELRDMIVDGAEGNPFYVEELIKMLIEDGIILRDDEQWRIEMDRLEAVRVPSTLMEVLQARLDILPQDEKRILQQASVIGRRFWNTAVAELADNEVEATQVDALLGAIRSRELIYRREHSMFVGTDEYIFRHALLRDATYETVLLKLRRVYHKQAAEWLQDHAGERINEYLRVIAGHYELAGEKIKAAEYLQRSGDELLKVSALCDAARAFEYALTLLPEENPNRIQLTIQVGYALADLDDYAKARQWLKKGLALADQWGDDKSSAAALSHLGRITLSEGNFAESRETLQKSLGLARQVDDQARRGYILYLLGFVDYRQGRYGKAISCFTESLELCQTLGHRSNSADALNGLGLCFAAQTPADFEKSQTYHAESMALCQGLGDRRGVARSLVNQGVTSRLQGDYATAQRHCREAIDIFREIGDQQSIVIGLCNLGHSIVSQGNDQAASVLYKEAIQGAIEIGSLPFALDGLAGLAGIIARAGQPERALELLGLVQHHPAFISETKPILAPILVDLHTKLPPAVVNAALERGKLLQLETVVPEILGG